MHTTIKLTAALATLSTALLLGSTPAFADDGGCPIIISDACESNRYENISLEGASPTSNPCGLRLACLGAHEPPADLSLVCSATATSGQFHCEAWPRGKDDSFSYDWFATGALSLASSSPSSSPEQTVSCNSASSENGGFVSVVVSSPYGLASTYFTALPCP